MTAQLRVVVWGYIVRGPLGGLAWHHLQYVLGLSQLGHDVWFVEDSDLHGLNAEGTTLEELVDKLPDVVADLLEANGSGFSTGWRDFVHDLFPLR